VAGYFSLFGNHEQFCADILAKMRDSTVSKCNLALLKYATESNCRWMHKIGINPATFCATRSESKLSNPGSKANLKKDQLIKMVDPRFLMDTIRELFRAISSQLFAHHLIARAHRNRLYLASGNDSNKTEKLFEKSICEFLTADRVKFFAFVQEQAISYAEDLLVAFRANKTKQR